MTGRRILILDIPAPAPWINSNDRIFRLRKADLTKQWRSAGLLAVPDDSEPFMGLVHVLAHIWKPKGGRYDPNNLWPTVKACFDGIVDSGRVVPDDDWKHVVGPDMRRGGKGEPRIVLTIEEAL